MRPNLLQVEAHHAADAGDVRHEIEVHRQPLAPFALLQQPPTVTDAHQCDGILRIDDDFEVCSDVRARLQQWIRRSGDLAMADTLVQHDALDDAAGDRAGLPLRCIRVQRERPGRALQIGRAHTRNRLARCFDWRIVRRNLKQSCVHAVAFEQLPERRALTQQFSVRRFQRDAPATERQRERRALDARRGHVRREGLAVEVQEIEDAMAAGIHTRDERRPRDRALRRVRRFQRHEAASGGEARQIRHDAFLHVLREQLRIHAVDAEDHHARGRIRAGGRAAGVQDRSEQGEEAAHA